MMINRTRAVDDCLFFKEDFPMRKSRAKAKPSSDWLDDVDKNIKKLRAQMEEKRKFLSTNKIR